MEPRVAVALALALAAALSGCSSGSQHGVSEPRSEIARTVVAGYGDHATSSGLDVGVFDLGSGRFVRSLDLPHLQDGGFAGMSVGGDGELLYAVGREDPRSMVSAHGKDCDSTLYRFDRSNGETTVLLTARGRALTRPVASTRPGTFAITGGDCDSPRRLMVEVDGRAVPVPPAAVGSSAVAWSTDGLTLLLQPPGRSTSYQLLTFRGGTAHMISRTPSRRLGCDSSAAGVDRYGPLLVTDCGHHVPTLLQVAFGRGRRLWQRALPLCSDVSLDSDRTGREVIVSGHRPGACGALTGQYVRGSVSRHRIRLSSPVADPPFFAWPTF